MKLPESQPYDTSHPCSVCGAGVGAPCRMYTDEFNEPGARLGDATPWPHRFGGRLEIGLDEVREAQAEAHNHCPACAIAAALLHHRDATAPEWSQRRGTLNFARIIAASYCPAYVENQALNKGEVVDLGTESGPESALTDRGLATVSTRPKGA